MAIVRWYERPDPRGLGGQMERMQREMNRLFSDFFGRGAAPVQSGVFPPLNVTEDQENLYVRAELPGILPDDLEISVEGETLSLRGERRLPAAENVSYHRRERESGRFRRILTLPARINPDAVDASFKNGVLKMVLPKAEEAKPKQIRIKSE